MHTAENVVLLVTSCSLKKLCVTDTSVSTCEFSRNIGIRQSSVGRFIFRGTHGKQCTYSIANVLSGSVATQLRWGGKLCMHLEAMIFRILFSKNYDDRLKLL